MDEVVEEDVVELAEEEVVVLVFVEGKTKAEEGR